MGKYKGGVNFPNAENICPECKHSGEAHVVQYTDPDHPAICTETYNDSSFCFCRIEK